MSQKSKDFLGYVVSAAALLLLFFLAIRVLDRDSPRPRRNARPTQSGWKLGESIDRFFPEHDLPGRRTPPPRGRVASRPGSGPAVEVPSPFGDSPAAKSEERSPPEVQTWAGGNQSWGRPPTASGSGIPSHTGSVSAFRAARTSPGNRPPKSRAGPPSASKIMNRRIAPPPPKPRSRGERRASLPAVHRPPSSRRRTELQEEPGNIPLEEATSSPEGGKKAGVPLVSGSRVGQKAPDPVLKNVMAQFVAERAVMDHVRERVKEDEEAGRPVDPERLKKQADDFVKETGMDPERVHVPELVARSLQPQPLPNPEELGKHAEKLFKESPPPTPEETKEILERLEKPPKKHEPPPKGAWETYDRNREAFQWARENLCVERHHILGILGVETNYGNYLGKHNVMKTLRAISSKGGRKGKQADRDLTAWVELDKRGELGEGGANSLEGSYAGASGIGQFLGSSWLAYARDGDGDGGKRDPFNYADTIVSVANYLKQHGYHKSVAKSVYGYNHSQVYVKKVLGLSDRIKAGLPEEDQTPWGR